MTTTGLAASARVREDGGTVAVVVVAVIVVMVVVVVVVVVYNGGWWYNLCGTSVLNIGNFHRGCWKTVGSTRNVQDSRMLVKLN